MSLPLNTVLDHSCNTTQMSFWGSKNPKKEIRRFLYGFQKQVEGLKKIIDTAFFETDHKQKWDQHLGKIKKKIVACEKLAGIKNTQEKKLLENLNCLSENCEKNTNQLNQFFSAKEIIETQKSIDFNSIIDSFVENSENSNELLKKTENKLQRLKSQIERQKQIQNANQTSQLDDLIFLLKKAVPANVILDAWKNLFTNNEQNIAKYQELKNAWLDSLMKHHALKDLVDRYLVTLKLLPTIASLTQTVEEQKKYFENLRILFEKTNIQMLTLGFKEKYQKKSPISKEELKLIKRKDDFYIRDLSEFMGNIKIYKKCLENFDTAHSTIEQLNQSMGQFLPSVKDSLSQISYIVKSIQKRDNETLNFVDDNIRNLLKKQNQVSIEKLHQLENEIEQRWNQFCLHLNEIQQWKKAFISFKNISEKISCCHILAESIQAELRNLRKTENNRMAQAHTFENESGRYNQLLDLILKKNNDLNIKGMEAILNDPFNIEISLAFPKNPNFTLSDEYTQTTKLQESIDLLNPITDILEMNLVDHTNHMAETIGLVWTSKTQSEVIDLFKKQKIILKEELHKQKENIKQGFTVILPAICEITAKEVNRVGSTLAEASGKYNERFTEAYWAESPIGQFLQVSGSAVTNTVSEWCGWTQPEDQASTPFIRVTMPFELINLKSLT